MRLPKILFIGLVLYTLIFAIYLNFIPKHYDDPDSFYYDSIGKHIEKEDKSLLGKIMYHFGSYAGAWMIYLMSLIVAAYIWLRTYKHDRVMSQYAALYFLFSPFIFFQNSWYQHLDKNMTEIFLFIIFIEIQMLYDRRKKFLYAICSIMLLIFASLLWQGYILFAVLTYFFIGAYEFMVKNNRSLKFWSVYGIMTLSMSFIVMTRYPHYMSLVGEGIIDIGHIIIPEFILFVLLFIYTIKSYPLKNPRLFTVSFIVLFSIFALPRLMLFLIPLTAIIFVQSKIRLSSNQWWIVGILLGTFFFANTTYFWYDNHEDIRNFSDPCKTFNVTDCIIITDWSYGHIYRNIWNESVYYIGHPARPYEILDYLYYKNKSCDKSMNCVYLWHPRDYKIFDQYVERLGLEKRNQTRRLTNLYAEIR